MSLRFRVDSTISLNSNSKKLKHPQLLDQNWIRLHDFQTIIVINPAFVSLLAEWIPRSWKFLCELWRNTVASGISSARPIVRRHRAELTNGKRFVSVSATFRLGDSNIRVAVSPKLKSQDERARARENGQKIPARKVSVKPYSFWASFVGGQI